MANFVNLNRQCKKKCVFVFKCLSSSCWWVHAEIYGTKSNITDRRFILVHELNYAKWDTLQTWGIFVVRVLTLVPLALLYYSNRQSRFIYSAWSKKTLLKKSFSVSIHLVVGIVSFTGGCNQYWTCSKCTVNYFQAFNQLFFTTLNLWKNEGQIHSNTRSYKSNCLIIWFGHLL